MTGDNRRRVVDEVVSLEAWHKPFSKPRSKVDLHVDVAFMAGRLGGEEESEVTFVLHLRQAEVCVIVPPGEPLKVDPASVSRDGPRLEAKLVNNRTVKKKAKSKASAKARLSATSPSLGLGLEGEVGLEASDETRMSITEAVTNMRLEHSLQGTDHRWKVTAVGGRVLEGRPWHAVKQPRLKLVDQRLDPTSGLTPTTRVEIRCRREDLEISDIRLKDSRATNWFKPAANVDLAAQAVIRTRLAKEGLFSGGLDDRYAVITLAAVVVDSD